MPHRSTTSLPVLNWSLGKLLATEQGSFNKARIKILHLFLLLALTKVLIVLFFSWHDGQNVQFIRAGILFVMYVVMFKLLFIDKSYVNALTHINIVIGILLIYSNLFFVSQSINIITLQFVFMVMLSSFYLLNLRFGVIYSTLSIVPLLAYLIITGVSSLKLGMTGQELAPAAIMIMSSISFLTIVAAHYVYHQAFMINVAEKEALNIKLKEAVKQANMNAQSKSDFLSTISHELRTPLNSVIGMTELLSHEPHSKEQEENLKILGFSAESLHTLINDLLDFNKFDLDKIRLEEIPVNLEHLVRNACSGLELQARTKGLSLVLEIDSAVGTRNVITDPVRITQVIYNLVGNAIKFTQKGKVTVKLHAEEKSSAPNMLNVHFSIADTGIGISADKHSEVFEPFVQASPNTTRNFGGTGLGLAIVKRLLALFGTGIRLESEPGKGSAFYFQIAFQLSQEALGAEEEDLGDEQGLSGLRLLLAEDNQMNILLIKKLCKRWNIELDIAENGTLVPELMKFKSHDIILMDIHMPLLDGYETTAIVRNLPDKQKAATPIIALTASITEDLQEKIGQTGMTDYLRKPFNAKDLYRKIRQIHSTHQAEAEEKGQPLRGN